MVGYYASPGIIGHMRVSNPSNLTTHFGPNSFIGVLFLYNFVILVGQVGHKNTVSHPTAITQSKDSTGTTEIIKKIVTVFRRARLRTDAALLVHTTLVW